MEGVDVLATLVRGVVMTLKHMISMAGQLST
jgi:hypothetical protein